jgi:DNA polymerase elongation subunit (family B)
MNEIHFEENQVLFGADPTRGIVAAELAGRFIRLFIRDKDGVRFRDEPFRPFILLTAADLLNGFAAAFELVPLAGEQGFRFLALFRDWHDCIAAREFLSRSSGRTPSAPDAPYLFLSDPVHQHLLLTGKTLFKGLPFSGLKRLALDIETYCAEGFEFSNPKREEDRIISIALMDADGYAEVLFGGEMDEAAMLERLGAIIREHDPDVIEGHNIFRFDLEYIRERAARHGVRLAWGRDGSVPRVVPSRFSVAERTIDYPRWNIYGRHIVDTYFLLQIYDVGAREMEGYGLKAAAIHFGFAAPDRVYLAGNDLTRIYREDPETLKRYNLDDVRETLALSRLLSYPHFLQTRIFPYSYQICPVRGTATKINSLFLREYLRQRTAIPQPGGGGGIAGGYTDVLIDGVVGPVLHCDVASLYPSIVLAYRLQPANDRLGLFLPLMRDLREFRLAAKKRAAGETDPHLRDYYQSLQQAFKVLINSFYGYLGTTVHHFADQELAGEVTRKGREIVMRMVRWLEDHGARIIEVDTDGLYFIPPPGLDSSGEEALVRGLSGIFPEGIDVELDGRYRTMFSYKAKNYALLDYGGRVTVRGSGLRSRGMEKYLREFLRELVTLLVEGRGEEAVQLVDDYALRLQEHRFPIEWLAKTETLHESPERYRQKVQAGSRNPSAAYELALRSGRAYRAGDQVSYYVAGMGKGVAAYEQCRPVSAYDPARPDENIGYYREKLMQLSGKFARYLPAERGLFD